MAKTWEGLLTQVRKINSVLEKTTPPDPDDEFEMQKANALKGIDQLGKYLHHKVTGEDV